jgi:hypothetical protein
LAKLHRRNTLLRELPAFREVVDLGRAVAKHSAARATKQSGGR